MDVRCYSAAAALLIALTATGCGGGGGATSVVATTPGQTQSPPATSSIPNQGPMNSLTSYTVYTGTVGTQSAIAISPLGGGTPANLINAAPAPGAVIYYPDSSVQIADVLGNFDASASSWATSNLDALIVNTNLQPEVLITAPPPAFSNVAPLDTTLVAYAPGGTVVTASGLRQVASSSRQVMDATAGGDVSGVAVYPRGVALFDNETRVFGATGQDTNGATYGLNQSNIAWSLATPQNCPPPAGRIAAISSDPSKARYTPPANGTFPFGCQDVVIASVTVNGAVFSGSGSAFYYDVSQGVTLSGTLNSATNQPVPGGVVSLYGGGREFYRGNLYALTNGAGAFSRVVPPNRTLYPIAGNVTLGTNNKPSLQFYTVSPSSIAVGAPNTTVANANLTEGAPILSPMKPLPPLERLIRDSHSNSGVAVENFPFGAPNASGTFAAGSVEAILAAPAANATGTVALGMYHGWTYTWDAGAKNLVLQQPSTLDGARHVVAITIGAAQFNGAPCPANNACFTFVSYYNLAGFTSAVAAPLVPSALPNGTILATDGGFAQSFNAGSATFSASYLRRDYSLGHQTIGAPLYTHLVAVTQQAGSQNMTISNQWSNAAGKPLGQMTIARVAASNRMSFTFSGTSKRFFYRQNGTTVEVDYAISNGTLNADCSGSVTITVTASPNPSDVGASVSWTINNDAAERSTGLRATGTVDNPNVTGLTTGHVATFKVDLSNIVTVTTDPSLGSNPIVFHL